MNNVRLALMHAGMATNPMKRRQTIRPSNF